MLNVILETTATAWNGVTAEMMTAVLDEIKSLLPIVASVSVGFIAFRKAWSFLKGSLKGA